MRVTKRDWEKSFFRHFVEAASQVRNYPTAWATISADTRRCRFNRFPYGLVYQIIDGEILILAVMHLHRQPTYWHHRHQRGRD